jgi:anhydro-N-acetylmuramic acid kinase
MTAATGTRLIAGAMSGTSADGVDVAITRLAGRGLDMTAELVLHHHRPYDPALRQAIFALRGEGRGELREIARIGREVSLTYAAAVTEALYAADLKASDLAAIAAHGQTLFHDVPLTIQYFDPSLVAYEVGCPVVSDFRRADIAAGGQGAPLVPFADYVLFRHATRGRILLNLGGIANLTYLPVGVTPDRVLAFDTGPANCVSDWLCRRHDPNGPGYDVGGRGALAGKPHVATAAAAARDEYIYKRPPKSTDGPAMVAAFEKAKRAAGFTGSHEDELATACLFTAYSIKTSLDLFAHSWNGRDVEVLASGGGTQNPFLMDELRTALAVPVNAMDATMVQAKEALAFALLGAATLDGVPSNVPSVTGARRGVVLGSVTPRP